MVERVGERAIEDGCHARVLPQMANKVQTNGPSSVMLPRPELSTSRIQVNISLCVAGFSQTRYLAIIAPYDCLLNVRHLLLTLPRDGIPASLK